MTKLECPQVQTDRLWPFWLAEKPIFKLGESLIKVIRIYEIWKRSGNK